MTATTDLRKLMNTQQVLTMGVTRYLLTTGEVTLVDPAVRERMVEVMSGLHVRLRGWHPSTLMECKRAQVFEWMGVPTLSQFSMETMNIFADGTWRHLRWQTMLLNAGLLDDVEVAFSTKDGMVGSLDGVGTAKESTFAFELKGIYRLNNELPYSAHIWQVQCYLYGRPDLDFGIIMYEDKGTQRFVEYRIDRIPWMQKIIKSRIKSLNEHTHKKELPDVRPDCLSQKGEEFKQCQYAHNCLKLQSWRKAEAEARKDPF